MFKRDMVCNRKQLMLLLVFICVFLLVFISKIDNKPDELMETVGQPKSQQSREESTHNEQLKVDVQYSAEDEKERLDGFISILLKNKNDQDTADKEDRNEKDIDEDRKDENIEDGKEEDIGDHRQDEDIENDGNGLDINEPIFPQLDPPEEVIKQKRKNVFFLKLHKTASSTVQNIFFRHADIANLTLALPFWRHRVCYPNVFTEKCLIPLSENYHEYNVLCFHMRYHTSVRKLMPKDTFFTTTIRSPHTQFPSGFNYHGFGKCYGLKTIEQSQKMFYFLDHLDEFTTTKLCGGWNVSSKSEMMFEFGLELPDLDDDYAIQEKIAEIDRDFNFIMITDYMKESLVLLAGMLNWELEDVVYFNKVERQHEEITNKHYKGLINKWNKADALMFQHYNKTFWKKLKIFGEDRMVREVTKLNKLLDYWTKQCLIEPENPQCVRMQMAEKVYTHEMKTKMIHEGRLNIEGYKEYTDETLESSSPGRSNPAFPYHTMLFKDKYPDTDHCIETVKWKYKTLNCTTTK
ncbi:unnamed protein product [Owenia fusiformis]|uniref:Uncharacterized protein n=1 Tax=Owenia fusiformis TaxID=6347 RepID=A0A8J1XX50_OWEFU|nr:unnamed protein product [Owenia fusiformis]